VPGPYTPEHHYTLAEYALQRMIKRFSNLIFQLDERSFTNTYWVVLPLGELQNIHYVAL